MEDNVKKILKARRVQKARIDQAGLLESRQEADIARFQQPVLENLDRNFDQHLQEVKKTNAIGQAQQQQLDSLASSIHRRLPIESQSDAMADDATDDDPTTDDEIFEAQDNKWIQSLIKRYRQPSNNRISTFEADYNGKIGEHGKIDMPKLLNNNQLVLTVNNRKILEIPENKLTEGLAALVLLPYKDIQDARIKVHSKDVLMYAKIMGLAEYKPNGKSAKYVNFLKQEKHGTGLANRSSDRCSAGLFPYKNTEDLEYRLRILIGSLKAGNTSRKIKSQVRTIADELLKTGRIDQRLHAMLYAKFLLMNA